MIYFLAIGPQNTLMARLCKDFISSNEEYALAQTAGRQETKDHMDQKLQAVRQKTSLFVVPADNTASLTFQINQLAARYQLQNFSTKTRQAAVSFENNNNVKIMESCLELNFSGNFNQAASFLNSLERNNPVIFVEGVNLHCDPRDVSLSEVHMQISYLIGKSENKEKASAL
jgi:hypothetical protein